MTNKSIAEAAVISALALALGYAETLIALPFPIPGIRLGLSNLAILFALYRLNTKNAWQVMFLKVTLSSLLISGMQSFCFSACGGIFSLFIMTVLKKKNFFSIIGISAAGGIFHNIGQLFAASAVMKTFSVFFYLPPLLISGIITGVLIGAVCKLLLRYIPL